MMGMGGLEVLVVLFVGFIVLGPSKMVDAARLIGKTVGQAKGLVNELHQIDIEEDKNNKDMEREASNSTESNMSVDVEDPVPFQAADKSGISNAAIRQENDQENAEDPSSNNRIEK